MSRSSVSGVSLCWAIFNRIAVSKMALCHKRTNYDSWNYYFCKSKYNKSSHFRRWWKWSDYMMWQQVYYVVLNVQQKRCAFSFTPQATKDVSLNKSSKSNELSLEMSGRFVRRWVGNDAENKIRVPGEGFCLLTPLVKRHLAKTSQRANTALAGHSRTKGRTLFEGRRARRGPPLSDANKHFDQILSKSVNSSNATLTFQCSGEVAGSVMLEYQVATNCSCCIQVPYVDITSFFLARFTHTRLQVSYKITMSKISIAFSQRLVCVCTPRNYKISLQSYLHMYIFYFILIVNDVSFRC